MNHYKENASSSLLEIAAQYKEARQLREDTQELYSEALKYTFPSGNTFYQIDNSTINRRDNSAAIFDDITLEVSETLANQMELSLTRAGDNWAGYDVEDPYNNYEASEKVDDKVREVFDHIHASNFQKEVSPVYRDLIIGTGVIKTYVGNVKGKKKLIYKHYNIGRSCFLEDALGDVDSYFYELPEYTLLKIEKITGQKYPESVHDKYRDKETNEYMKIRIIELCVPTEKGYVYKFVDCGFETEFYSKDLNYQPFSVPRFGKRNDISTWGIGKAIERLALMKSIQHFAKTRLNVLDRDSRPTYFATTPNKKQPEIKLIPDAIIFGAFQTTITPLFTQVNMQQLSSDIEDLRAQLKQAFLVDSILEAQAQNTYKSA